VSIDFDRGKMIIRVADNGNALIMTQFEILDEEIKKHNKPKK
jgi:hypothetical protein